MREVAASRVAIVTGGSMGIGRACARRLVEDGVSVLLCSRNESEAQAAAEAITKGSDDGVSAMGVRADVGIPRDCERLVEQCLEEFGRVDIVVNNAGIYEPVPFLDFTAETWDKTLTVNLRGPVLVSVGAARWMRDHGGGRIVHIASTNGHAAEREFAHYNASKAALISLTQSMAVELALYGIAVNAVAPGWIATPLSEDWVGSLTDAQLRRVCPLARVGSSEEIAEVVAFLCRPSTGYVTGETVNVDGGMMAMLASPFD